MANNAWISNMDLTLIILKFWYKFLKLWNIFFKKCFNRPFPAWNPKTWWFVMTELHLENPLTRSKILIMKLWFFIWQFPDSNRKQIVNSTVNFIFQTFERECQGIGKVGMFFILEILLYLLFAFHEPSLLENFRLIFHFKIY